MKHYSKQREAILGILKDSYHHPTAEEVYQQTVDMQLGMSKSTVYRNLNLLTEEGVVLKLSTVAGADRYDYIEKQHHHAICHLCGKVYDFHCDVMTNQVLEAIKKQTNMETIGKSIIVQGICEECQSKI